MIPKYWFRVLFTSSLISDVSHLIMKFLAEFDSFDMSMIGTSLRVEDDNTMVTKHPHSRGSSGAFGTIIATPGQIYHWKIKIMNTPWSESFNHTMKGEIGIIEADK